MPPSIPAPRRRIPLEPLTQDAFAAFGTVIENPARSLPSQRPLTTSAVSANQGTALKYIDVTHMTNYYHLAPSRKVSKAVMNMFVCSPRKLRPADPLDTAEGGDILDDELDRSQFFDINILERHPFTSQTFIPMGLSAADNSTKYLVIVAPTLPKARSHTDLQPPPYPVPDVRRRRTLLEVLSRSRPAPFTNETTPPSKLGALFGQEPGQKPKGPGLPDLSKIRAFIANGSQAVTYGAGTWHAPMVVLGGSSVDFVVVQFANGVSLEDCQEVELRSPYEGDEGLSVEIDYGDETWTASGGIRAKL